MPTEIERKFLIINDLWRKSISATHPMRQGYLSNNQRASVRVRVSDEKAKLNIKSMTLGIERQEYEYTIPIDEARTMLDTLCEKPLIEKIRYHVPFADHLWEVDVFAGDNEGLIVAEVELKQVDEQLQLPPWLGHEVSSLKRYYNVCLQHHPYTQWTEREKLGLE